MPDSTSMPAPAGWYPAGTVGRERYWDGATWTDQERPIGDASAGDGNAATTDLPAGGGVSAGWYRDPHTANLERYWDGNAWTQRTRPVAVAPATAIPVAASGSRAWYRRKAVIIPVAVVGGVLVLSGLVNAVVGGRSQTVADQKSIVSQAQDSVEQAHEADEQAPAADVEVPATEGMTAKEGQAVLENAGLDVEFSADRGVVLDRDNWTVLGTVPAAGETAKVGDRVVVKVRKTAEIDAEAAPSPVPAPEEPAPAAPALSLGQQNAIDSARSYLGFTSFSRAGLAQQLTSDYGSGYEAGDAEFAIAYLEGNGQVDWNAEAVEAAKSYLDMTSFSRQGLYDQLTSEYGSGFTPDQANYALGQVGY